ncbi:serine/threonine-protein kinase pak-2-like [Phascolarctos cinereus]
MPESKGSVTKSQQHKLVCGEHNGRNPVAFAVLCVDEKQWPLLCSVLLGCCGLFKRKNRRLDISAPFNFQHRVHTVFLEGDGKFVGLPVQWSPFMEQPVKEEPDRADPSSVTPLLRPWCCITHGSTKKMRLEISKPCNFQHSVHMEFDPEHHIYTGLPLQWRSLEAEIAKQAKADPPSSTTSQLAALKPCRASCEDTRAALQLVCSLGDPREFLTDFVRLGEGATAIVERATVTDTEKRVAIKRMAITQQKRPELLLNEVAMGNYEHENIVVMYNPPYLVGDELWVLMELLEGGALTEIVTHMR